MPWYLLYDYVEVFDWNEKTNTFELNWRDDFDRLDTQRWHVAEGGFEQNSSEFVKENVFTYDGKLVIKMELDEDKKQER